MNSLLNAFGQTYTTTYSDPTLSASTTKGLATMFLVIALIAVPICILLVAAMWRIFTKAGKPGWAAIVPIYNYIVELEIVGRPVWWVVFLFAGIIPFVGSIVALVFMVMVTNSLAKSFGKGTGFTCLLIFLPIVGYPMLAWGDAQYQGPAALNGAGGAGGPAMGGQNVGMGGTPPSATPPAAPPTSMPQ